MELTYSEVNGYRIPDLAGPVEPTTLGRFARKRREYLKNHKKVLFTNLLTSGKLGEHLTEIEKTARTRLELMIPQMAADKGVTEDLKATDQMKWVGLMNNIRHSAEEIIMQDLIYN